MALPFTALIPLVGKVFDQIFPDKTKADEAKLKLLELQQAGQLAELDAETKLALGQIAVNAEEAKSPNVFISGARPFIMWVCGAAFAYATVLEPIARFVASVYFKYDGAFPAIDTSLTMQVMFGILGLGAYRTVEKIRGAEGNR